jgi:ADP-heptose:LPS heptosyltransferase
VFHSIEINPAHFSHAVANLRAAGLDSFVRLFRGLSVPRALLPTMAQIEDKTVRRPEYDDIFVDHQETERARLYFAETNFTDCPDDLLGGALAGFGNRPDFVLLDSGGHMGFVEFQYLVQKLAGPCLIALDDIHHIKHHHSLRFMRHDPRFELLVESQEKFGFCIARFTPAAAATRPTPVQRILWVRTDSIGDGVLASSMLEPIRKKYPGATLAVLCQKHVAELYAACPLVDSIICFDLDRLLKSAPERQQILDEIAALQPDLVLNSTRSRDALSDALALAANQARHVAIEGDLDNVPAEQHARARAKYEVIIPTPDAPQTELERHASFLRGLDIETAPLQPVVWTATTDEALADAFFKQQGLAPAQTIAVFPGAQRDARVYHRYGEALQSLKGFRFLVFGTAAETPLAEELERQLPGRTVNLCGRSTLGETAALLRRCRLYVGAESGGAHLACAVGVPNVVLLGGGHFGRFMPYSPLTSAVILPMDCFACNWRCRFDTTRCVAHVAPEVLTVAIVSALKGPRQKPALFAQTAPGADTALPALLATRVAPESVYYIPVPVAQPLPALVPASLAVPVINWGEPLPVPQSASV